MCCYQTVGAVLFVPIDDINPIGIRAANRNHRNPLKTLVADAVVVEPVSTLKFPANREKNREYCNFKLEPVFS
jgi:hypothetical protein